MLLAGFGAGLVLTAAGAGSLVSFPLLLSTGLSPLSANVCNNVGLIAGGVTGSLGFRNELRHHRRLVVRVAATSAAGALLGAALLLQLPATTFDSVVPYLVLGSATLVGLQPLVAWWLRRRTARRGGPAPEPRHHMGPGLTGLSSLVGVYGGYFGAAQGVMLIAFLGLGLDVDLRVVNGLKNIAVLCANIAAGVVFVLFGPLHWGVVALLAVGALVGGWLGAHVARRMPPVLFRTVVVVVGYIVGLQLLLG